MADIKPTKSELRLQQNRLHQLEIYLPTLQLKKALLQKEVEKVRHKILQQEELFKHKQVVVLAFSHLLTFKEAINPLEAIHIKNIRKKYENIAGVEVAYFESIEFEPLSYSLFETPPWMEKVISEFQDLIEMQVKVQILEEQRTLLEEELRRTSIRVNLFEKVLIPRALQNIRWIKNILGDRQLADVCRAKVAKEKKDKEISVGSGSNSRF